MEISIFYDWSSRFASSLSVGWKMGCQLGRTSGVLDAQFDDVWIETRVWYILVYAIVWALNLGRDGWKACSMMWFMGSASTCGSYIPVVTG